MNWNLRRLDEQTGLHENFVFWCALLIPFLVAFLLSFPVMFTENLTFDFSSNGYKLFLETFAFPISISSLSILFGVMVGRFHGSKQRSVSITEAINNNTLKNYYDHRGSFYSHMNKFDWKGSSEENVRLKHPFKLYKLFFPENSPLYFLYSCDSEVFWQKICCICDSAVNDFRDVPNIEKINHLFSWIGCECHSEIDMAHAVDLFSEIIEYSLNFCEIDEVIDIEDIQDTLAMLPKSPPPDYNPRKEY